MPAIDEHGRELTPRGCTVIAPAEHIDEARRIACAHETERRSPAVGNRAVAPADMLPTPLSPTGKLPATHYICSRAGEFDDVIDGVAATLTAFEANGFTSGRIFGPADDPEEYRGKFCQFVGPKAALLKRLGLREIAG